MSDDIPPGTIVDVSLSRIRYKGVDPHDIPPGTIVDVSLSRIRYKGVDPHDGRILLALAGTDYSVPATAVLRASHPDQWPPRPGDLWLSAADGRCWFFYLDLPGGTAARLNLRNERGEFVDARGPQEPADWLLAKYPVGLTLLSRRTATQ